MAKPYDPKDFYFRKAKKAGLRARSAFKIEEILQRHRLLARGDAVLDLGAAPGGFLQILAEAVGEKGVAVGVDLEPIRNLGKPWVRTAVVDLLAPDALERIRALHPGRFRFVTSDMAPKTIGIKVTDEARSLELVRMALAVAEQTLAPGGAFVAKVFMGGDFPVLRRELQARFESFHIVRPEATRESSYEVYVLGKGFRGTSTTASVPPAPAPTATPPPAPVPEARVPGVVGPGPTPPTPTTATATVAGGPPSPRPSPPGEAGGEGGPWVSAPAKKVGREAGAKATAMKASGKSSAKATAKRAPGKTPTAKSKATAKKAPAKSKATAKKPSAAAKSKATAKTPSAAARSKATSNPKATAKKATPRRPSATHHARPRAAPPSRRRR